MGKLTTNEFIKRAKKVHGNKYDYSKVEYNGSREKVCIICPEHGEFWQNACSHIMGSGCPECYSIKKRGKTKQHTTEWFIEKARTIHGDKYDYSKVEYKTMTTKVCIICPEHGEFWQAPLNHLQSNGCYKCGREHHARTHSKTTEMFIDSAIKKHGDKYDYSKVEYINARTKVCIICPEHGEFWQVPNYHLSGNGCPKCNESTLEREIMGLLNEHKIEYVYQCGKDNLEWIGRQSLDFYLPSYKIAIECQGSQHLFSRCGDLYNHDKTVKRDVDKFIKCSNNGVKILYYSNFDPNFNIPIYRKNNFFNDSKKLIEEIIL